MNLNLKPDLVMSQNRSKLLEQPVDELFSWC